MRTIGLNAQVQLCFHLHLQGALVLYRGSLHGLKKEAVFNPLLLERCASKGKKRISEMKRLTQEETFMKGKRNHFLIKCYNLEQIPQALRQGVTGTLCYWNTFLPNPRAVVCLLEAIKCYTFDNI